MAPRFIPATKTFNGKRFELADNYMSRAAALREVGRWRRLFPGSSFKIVLIAGNHKGGPWAVYSRISPKK